MQNLFNFQGDYSGISSQEAEEQLKMYGYNTGIHSKHGEEGRGFRTAGVFISPRFLLMVLNALIFIITLNIGYASVLLFLSALYAAVEIYRGTRCDESLRGLKRSGATKFRVVRDGEIILLRREYIVPDDIIILQEGESVPADAHLLEVYNVTADESIFTGNKTPAVKSAGADTKNEIKQTCIYKGTRILSGNLIARVIATGVDSRQYKLSADNENERYYSGIESFIKKVNPVFIISSIVLTASVWVFSFISYDSNSVFDSFITPMLVAVSFGLCFLPAETSACVRFYYVHGARRLAKKNSLVKDISVLENLGALTAVCVDKAGVITKSRIELAEEYSKDSEMLTNISLLSCETSPVSQFDQAIILGAAFKNVDIKELQQNELVKSFPFTGESKIGGNLWKINGARILCVKGSPENVFNICNIQPDSLYKLQKKQLQYSRQGHQVIAVAYSRLAEDREIPESVFDVTFTFAGLLAFTNRTRDSVPAAVRGCYRAGADVIMLTGDSVDTAFAIGKKIGLKSGGAITGEQMKKAHEYGEKLNLDGVNIFARINAEQKLEAIKLLQENGEIIGITGESAADVEVLRQADVGIIRAVNASGAAQEACGLIMNDDKFTGIVDALREARQLHKNIKRAISVSMTAFAAQALFALFNIAAGGEFYLNSLIVSLFTVVVIPACMMFFIDNRSDMKDTLKSSGFIGRGKLDKSFILGSLYRGLALFTAMAVIYLTLSIENFEEVKRAGLLAVMTSGIITASWSFLSDKSVVFKILNKKNSGASSTSGTSGKLSSFGTLPLTVTGILLILLLLVIYVPFIAPLFRINALEPLLLLFAVILGFVSQLPFDLVKLRK